MKKKYLITGASSGIGQAVFERFDSEGHQTVLLGTSFNEKMSSSRSEFIQLDLSDPKSVADISPNLGFNYDAFINCAGVSFPQSVENLTLNHTQRIIDINFTSAVLLTNLMVSRLNVGSSIIHFSSQSAFRGSYDDVYAATKGAIHSFVKSCAPKLAPNIRINCIAPGLTLPSRMLEKMSAEHLEKKRLEIPMKTFANASDIASVVEFLLSDSCSYMTGATFDINGGYFCR